MRQRRIALIVGGLGCLVTLGLGAYVIAVSRNCDEAWNVLRGSFRYRLCGMGSELITAIPVVEALAPPTYSWKLADGTKPGHKLLRYDSGQSPEAVRTQLVEFLKHSGFTPKRVEKDHEWWAESTTELSFAVTRSDGHSKVEVLEDTGLD
jgi:hypothetical protein